MKCPDSPITRVCYLSPVNSSTQTRTLQHFQFSGTCDVVRCAVCFGFGWSGFPVFLAVFSCSPPSCCSENNRKRSIIVTIKIPEDFIIILFFIAILSGRQSTSFCCSRSKMGAKQLKRVVKIREETFNWTS